MPSNKKNCESTCFETAFNKLLKLIADPVEFELPESFSSWTPTPYSNIKRNLYLTKKIKSRKDDGIFCSCSPSNESSRVCGRDCHCGMLLSSCSLSCKCGSACLNRPFHQRPVKKMKLVKTEKCGSGVVADEDIKKGEFVIEYVGEVIDDKECEKRLWNMKGREETNFYLCEINRDMVIDATNKGNISRYINHSCSPNTEMQKWTIYGETRIGIFATRDINKGNHLNYDYQYVQFGADQNCHCGANGCRQKLGAKLNKFKAKSPKKDVYQNRGLHKGNIGRAYCNNCIGEVILIKRPVNKRDFGIIKRFDKFSRKHMIMFEDGSVEFLDMTKEEWELLNF